MVEHHHGRDLDAPDKKPKPDSRDEHPLSHALSEVSQARTQSASHSKAGHPGPTPDTIDFGTDHPFSAQEIADSGTINAANQSAIKRFEYPSRKPPDSPLSSEAQTLSGAMSHAKEEGTRSGSPAHHLEDMGQAENKAKASKEGGAVGIDQGGYGDCWFESSLASVATTTKGDNDLSKMITQSPSQRKDGSYTVTFPGDKSHPVTVTEKDWRNRNENNASPWADIVETAAHKLYPQQFKHGGDPTVAIHLLTGDNTSQTSSLNNLPDDRSTMQNALNSDNPVVATSKQHQPHGSPFVSYHAYQVVRSDSDTVTLRNPWGDNGDGISQGPFKYPGQTINGVEDLGGGELQMPLRDLPKYFGGLEYGDKS